MGLDITSIHRIELRIHNTLVMGSRAPKALTLHVIILVGVLEVPSIRDTLVCIRCKPHMDSGIKSQKLSFLYFIRSSEGIHKVVHAVLTRTAGIDVRIYFD